MSRLLCLLAACIAWSAGALAGDFGVSPIRLDLDRATKSAVLTVTNDGDQPLAFQIRVMRWTQDEAGADKYAPTNDIVYFPQQLRIPPKEKRVVRVGYKVPAIQSEESFRVYVEQLADAASAPEQTGIVIRLRFGVPLFLRPIKEQRSGEAELALSEGVARARIRNSGNVHFRLNSVRFAVLDTEGKPVSEHSLDGWYVLAGAERTHAYKLPPEACARGHLLRAEALAEKLILRAERPLRPEDCR
jgi:fimbrial chaperone protein